MPRWRPLALSLAAAIVVAGCNEERSATAVDASECDSVASPDAIDGPSGVQELADSLARGQTGCLREGTYAGDDEIVVGTPDVTLSSYPGERAVVVGRLVIDEDGSGVTLADLELVGRNAKERPSPTINASDVTLIGNDISNDHTAICVHVNDFGGVDIPERTAIVGNRIHDCGSVPATNLEHGVYLGSSRDAVVRGNWIYANADRGIQLYPDADGTFITGNVVDGNGQGVIIAGGEDSHSDDNVVEGNAITNSTIRYNVEANWQGPVGTGNLVRHNCVHGGARGNEDGGIQRPSEGFEAVGNLIADPRYLDADAGDFELADGSPCAALLAGPAGEL